MKAYGGLPGQEVKNGHQPGFKHPRVDHSSENCILHKGPSHRYVPRGSRMINMKKLNEIGKIITIMRQSW